MAAPGAAPKSAAAAPGLDVEHGLIDAGARFVIGCDEVGRGALAGPVAVGVALVDRGVGAVPEGLRDSKLITERRRPLIDVAARAWVLGTAVGLASADEVDRHGIVAALGLAGRRAIAELGEAAWQDAAVLLDGSHDWLSGSLPRPLRVVTRAKADRDCASVAAASVIAKVHRDDLMVAAHDDWPVYGWNGNKGYGSAAHLAAIAEHGPSEWHRRTWLRNPA